MSEPAACSSPLARNGGRTAFGEGVYVSVGSGKLERSTNGMTWTPAWQGMYPVEAVAFGYVDQ
jgi:hypothetical protein